MKELVYRSFHGNTRALIGFLFFIWLAFKNKLLTNMERVQRHLGHDAKCPVCQLHEEDTLHVLRDCGEARLVRKYFIPRRQWDSFFSGDL